MDVNGTRFHLLLGAADWQGADTEDAGVAWNADEGALELASLPFVFPPRKAETPPGIDARRGAGRDRFGNWYWIGDDRATVLARAPRDTAPHRFWPPTSSGEAPAAGEFTPIVQPAQALPRPLRALAVTTEHYLVVGMLEPAGLLVFDLAAGGPPVAIRWPTDVPFVPWDLASAPDGGVWLLDRVNTRLWSLDRQFRVRAAALPEPAAPSEPEFELATPPSIPVEPAPSETTAPDAVPVSLMASLDIAAVPEVVAVESLCDGSALLLGRDATANAPALYRYTLDGAAGTYRLAAMLGAHTEVRALLPRAHDIAFVASRECSAESISGTLYLVAPNGNQSFAFRVWGEPAELEFRFMRAFYPMRRFGGRALVAAGGEPHYDSGERWVSLLEQPRPRYSNEGVIALPPSRTAGVAAAFDGKTPGCVWHRLFLDACIPPGTSVTVESRAADSLTELSNEAWQTEPVPYLRVHGSELPWRKSKLPHNATGAGTWELLFQAARGRFLQLRLTLRSNGRSTARLHALRVYYPRFSYLSEYLPAVWREDPASAAFLDRFLANVEGTLTEIEGRIAGAQVLFDTRTVPAEFLDWLASWLGGSLDAAWDERKRRFFLSNALRMFAQRGTRDGLVRALRLALEDCADPALFDTRSAVSPRFTVRIVERFLARSAPGVAYNDIGNVSAPAAATPGQSWTPALGAEPLHAQWREWVAGQFADHEELNTAWGTNYDSLEDRNIRLSPIAPAGAQGVAWRRFVRAELQFTYAVPDSADLALWRDFLTRRYAQVTDLNRAWRLFGAARHSSFDAVPFPSELAASGAALGDWITFVSVVLPMRRGAHRFTVLVPVRLEDPPAVQRARRELVDRVAALEKPAHTIVESRLYWAAFQVGSARLGTDSVLGVSSRFAALLIGSSELGSAYLGWTEPWNVHGRRIVGRDPVAVRPQTQGLPARCA